MVVTACAASAGVGWLSGYRVIWPYLTFWSVSALAIATAWNLRSRLDLSPGLADAVITTTLLATAVIVACGLVLGALKRVTVNGFVVAQFAAFAGSMLLRRPAPAIEPGPRVRGSAAIVIGIIGALLITALAFAVTQAPFTLYDSLSYHLFFPARWLQEHALSIIPTPFSDEAQAYAPANGELWFLWLMLPFHGDVFARLGQVPFGLLAMVTLYALARRLGASPAHAIYPPAFFLLARPVLEQFVGADVDLICAAFFLVALWRGLVAIERDRPADWILWGIAVGLFAGIALLRLLSSLLFGVHLTSIGTYTEVLAMMSAIGLIACYIPAARAVRVDPIVALRQE